MINLSSFIRFHALRSPGKLAIVCGDQRLTYQDLLARIEMTAGALAARGAEHAELAMFAIVAVAVSMLFTSVLVRHVSRLAAVAIGLAGVGFSDHWSFWQEGYPAAMVTDTAMFRYAHYHLPSDTPEKVDEATLQDCRCIDRHRDAWHSFAGGHAEPQFRLPEHGSAGC